MPMTPRERVMTVIRGEVPDRVPRAVAFFPTEWGDHPGRLPGEDFHTDLRFAGISAPSQQRGFMNYLRGLPQDIYVGTNAILKTYHDWGYHPEIERDAPLGDVKTIAEIARAPLPSFMSQVKPLTLARQVETFHEAGFPVIASPPHLGGELFETAYRLRGFEQFMLDLADNPPLVEYLLDQLTAMHLAVSLTLTRAGIDILALDDDYGENTRMLISPAMWRTYFKPRVRAIIDTCRIANPDLTIMWHSDGYIEPIIPELIEIGVDILHPVQPDVMDPAKLKRQYGDKLAFFGTVGTAQSWAWSTPEAVTEEVYHRIETVGKGGGLILAPSYDLEPAEGIPWANVRAFFEAVDAYGEY